ncbi:MAG: hypothetical protein LBB41_05790 [Prevotellaceae bacterium]|jgi:hypothetical protein|nr:hypothetical protein [Prevotellaceae bacterium]
MKKIKIFITFIAVASVCFTACKDYEDIVTPGANSDVQGVYFPAVNVSAVELEPTEPTEITVTIARTDSVSAQEVPLAVVEDKEGVFVVPEKVSFAAGEKETTFNVSFPSAAEGITYTLKLSVKDNDYVKPYSVNVTRIKWTPIDDPFIFVDGTISAFFGIEYPFAMYANAEKTELGASVRYRMLNVFALPTDQDADGIYTGYKYNEPGDVLAGNYYITIEIDENGKVYMFPSELGMDWTYGMFSIGTVFGNKATISGAPVTEASYPLGKYDEEAGIITCDKNSLYISMADLGWRVADANPTVIYLTKDAYLKANMKIKDYNDVEYEPIEGGVIQLFESASQSASWNVETFAKAVDMDVENENSEYKNLYYLADLYAEGYGLAFYYNSDNGKITIPQSENASGKKVGQKTGIKFMDKDVWVTGSDGLASQVTVNGDVTLYSFGLKFIYEDGTVLGEFIEKFYYSEVYPYSISDFTGNFTFSYGSQYEDPSEIFDGGTLSIEPNSAVENGVILKDFYLAGSEIEADLDLINGKLLVPDVTPIGLVESGGTTYMLVTYNLEVDAPIEFIRNSDGTLVCASMLGIVAANPSTGQLIGYWDELVNATFTPETPEALPARIKHAPILKSKINFATLSSTKKIEAKAAKAVRHSNFKVQGKPNPKMLKKNIKTSAF